jgi:WD40 repeat protein
MVVLCSVITIVASVAAGFALFQRNSSLPFEDLPENRFGEAAIVSRPTPTPGVVDWTIESRRPRGAIADIECSPVDDSYAVVSRTDCFIRLFDIHSHQLVGMLGGHQGPVTDICIAKTGRSLASAGMDRTVRLWDLSEDRLIRVVARDIEATSVQYSPDDSLLAVGKYDGTIAIYETESWQLNHVLMGHDGPIHDLSWSRDGDYLIGGSNRALGTCCWEVAERMIVEWPWEPKSSGAIHSPDGKYLAELIIGDQSSIRIYEWDSRQKIVDLEIPSVGLPRSLRWSPDSSQVATCRYGEVLSWDVGTWKRHRHLGVHNYRSLNFSRDGQRIIVGGKLADISAFNIKLGGLEQHLPGIRADLLPAAWSGDKTRLAVVGDGRKSVDLVHFDTTPRIEHVSCKSIHTQHLFWANGDNSLVLVGPNRQSGYIEHIHLQADPSLPADVIEFQAKPDLTAWRDETQEVVVWDNSKRVVLVVDSEGNQRQVFHSQSQPQCVALSPNGNLLALGHTGGRVNIFTLNADQIDAEQIDAERKTNQVPSNKLHWPGDDWADFAWEGTSERLACATRDGRVRIIDRTLGTEEVAELNPRDRIATISWCGSNHLTATTHDATYLLEIQSGKTSDLFRGNWHTPSGENEQWVAMVNAGQISLINRLSWKRDYTLLDLQEHSWATISSSGVWEYEGENRDLVRLELGPNGRQSISDLDIP